MEKTLCIIKPDAVANGFSDKINEKISSHGLTIINSKQILITRQIAEEFYAEHSERPFFGELVDFMTSGEAVVQILEGENAIKAYRGLMGATNPAEADEGTLRALFAESLSKNAVHGSDSLDSAEREINIMSDIF
ncbi:nucleoside-diphosphate kinase [SAR86 cluster bacterium]|jgi:nucleoside-diphosphate kinase|nr:nucleoside-diphosphate kinase [SAR86 cluster bacterium]